MVGEDFEGVGVAQYGSAHLYILGYYGVDDSTYIGVAIGYAVEFGKAAFDEVVMQGLLREPQYSWWLEGLCLCYMPGRTP